MPTHWGFEMRHTYTHTNRNSITAKLKKKKKNTHSELTTDILHATFDIPKPVMSHSFHNRVITFFPHFS